MSQGESPQPTSPSGQRLSRDTMVLIGALAFMIIAVSLTFMFAPSSDAPTAQRTPITITISPEVGSSSVAALPTPISTTSNNVGGSYPIPNDPSSAYPNPIQGTPTALGTIAVGTPTLTATRTALDLETTFPLDSAVAGEFGYPIPQPEGTQVAVPTFRPTMITATVPRQVAQGPTSAPAATVPPAPTEVPAATSAPAPTSAPAATSIVEPTSLPVSPKEPPPTEVPTQVLPTLPPVQVLRGSVRWSIDQSPITLHHDVQVAPGAELIIEPGVEIRIDPGISIYVDGARMMAMGQPNQPVRFVGTTRARWSGIFGRPQSFMVLEHTYINGGGAGGTVMAVESSELFIRNSRITDNGGGVLITDTKLEIKDSEISGNDIPFGAALEAAYARGTTVTLQRNRIGGNRLSEGAPMVRFANQSSFSALLFDVSGNLFRGGLPNFQILSNGPLQGNITCNAFVSEGQGLGLRTQTLQVNPNGAPALDLVLHSNIIDDHIPPVIPIYLKYGLGRGATSEVLIDMRNNWWGDATGPYEPDTNPLGRGDSVGNNILFAPWLTQAPSCAPMQ